MDTIVEKNIKIALFEGAIWEENQVITKKQILRFPNSKAVNPEALSYDADWNDLQRAWKKAYSYLRVSGGVAIIVDMGAALIESDLNTAYNILVRAVEFVNEKANA